MSKALNHSEPAKGRAARMSLRVFRRTASVVGETDHGEPILEVDSVRLVLPDGGDHFRAIVSCTRCGRTTYGESILNSAQLRSVGSNVLCEECTRPAEAGVLEGGRTAELKLLLDARLGEIVAGLRTGLASEFSSITAQLEALPSLMEQREDEFAEDFLARFVERFDALSARLVVNVGDRLDRAIRDLAAAISRGLSEAHACLIAELTSQVDMTLGEHQRSIEKTIADALHAQVDAINAALDQRKSSASAE